MGKGKLRIINNDTNAIFLITLLLFCLFVFKKPKDYVKTGDMYALSAPFIE